MANVNRYHHGKQTIVQMPVASATVIEIGDFVCYTSGYAVSPSSFKTGNAASTNARAAAEAAFVGMALSASASGETDPINVDISLESVYELALKAAAALSFTDKIEIYAASWAAASFVCEDDTCVAGATSQIAVCVKEKSATGTKVLAKMIPNLLMNKPQA